MLLCSPAGNDLLYDDSLPEQGRNFANKIWNAFRLVKSWNVDEEISQPEWAKEAIEWFENKFALSLYEYNRAFDKFRISDALMIVYRLFWEEYSSWYLESVKPDYKKAIDAETFRSTLSFLDRLLRIIHPFMPFITEEIWQLIAERDVSESIMISGMPDEGKSDKEILKTFDQAKQIIGSIRTIRKETEIPANETLVLLVKGKEFKPDDKFKAVVSRLSRLEKITLTDSKPDGAVSFIVGTTEFFISAGQKMDLAAELDKLEQDLNYNRGFLKSVLAKLGDERFISNAPPSVVDIEKKKKSDTELKIRSLDARIEELKNQLPN